ncbi:PREDICTED: uncharacterized protein LOC108777862 [Cyphomyrmex costatus]|uniref:CYTH domain-containing protein n=1 Tax=Cyphomyrmex costatus TaxID=456900 RepID=A0A195CCY8_9HYME|nr:PREDICTED: uncharacterized protein LOC108777862 [Cyphomyrmex costatus]KYM97948.1 hypothetical protein ALC62_11294 [Cyphomyrmex costatus]
MHRNVEIKAVIRDIEHTISKATELSDTAQIEIKQHDTFFKTKEGRLKLRKFKDGTAELILYKRPDVSGPKLSTYDKVLLNSDIVESIGHILTQSNGVLGVVKKTRLLFIVGQTRVHIDKVDGLGNFIELEVVLKEDQDIITGQKIADDLMQALFIKKDDLIAEAYIDLLNSKT